MSSSDFEAHFAFFKRLFVFTSRERMKKAVDSRPAGQWTTPAARIFAGKRFEQRGVSEKLTINTIRIVSQSLICC